MTELVARARAYVGKMPPAVAGQHGHDATFKVAVALVHGFGLPESDAMPIIEEYSSRCSPPWSKKELEHKLRSATRRARSGKPRGYLRNTKNESARAKPPPRPVRPKKKISLDLTASLPVEERIAAPATEPASGPARPGTPDPPPWLDEQMALFRDHGHVEGDEDARLLRLFLAIVTEESDRLKLAVSDDEARAAALALRKDLAAGLIAIPEAGRQLVPMTIEILRRIGLGHAEGRDGSHN